ncbi:drug:proton antiporter [Sphingomonas sp. Sph1(2015)]|jgi:catechol 2,3-dioxygenase-like lactoylglutathione lyase family enzyme|uniref:VOC family protein n=1 Tax=Sphingomonas sp. Sph1(2015) TaxID=1628084 RepID=UPI0009785674|nr:VOC family protein [Sphingomonas sp. Sph1(2015)]OMJ33895.1 drug:proton antiporter [Sphingomonas sp. Sph1(2015)]
MTCPTTTILLHIADMGVSTDFYRGILGRDPVDAGDAFTLFALDSGTTLGLWRRDVIEPVADGESGAIELGFWRNHDGVDACHADWLGKGVAMLMPPTDRPFGRSFVALDPDGHRLRVYALNG